MRYGLTFPNVGIYADARTLADLANLAEVAGWDGLFLWDTIHYHAEEKAVCEDGHLASLIPDEIGKLKAFMHEHRTNTSPFDIVVGGRVFDAIHDEQAQATLRAYSEAGATWCMENVGSQRDLDGLRTSIQQGPPHLE